MRTLRVDVGELALAMGLGEGGGETYLDVETGETVFVPEDESLDADAAADRVDASPERYVRIEPLSTRAEHDWMSAFAASLSDEEARDALRSALTGRGAFGRFRRYVDASPPLRDAWLSFRHTAETAAAVAWLAEHGIAPESLPGPAGPVEPPRTVRDPDDLELVDLLVLGGPEGKTELLDGAVLRVLRCGTPDLARARFQRFAREICEKLASEAWRKRFAQSATTFERGRLRLEVHGTELVLRIATTRRRWDAFCR